MRLAIREARKNLKTMHGGPFGACIVKGNKVLAVSRNLVLKKNDPTLHAEICAIKEASRKLGDFVLSGCVLYSTCEPCPMCFSAIHWARIDAVVYGANILDAKNSGFNELSIPANKMKQYGNSKVRVFAGFMPDDCRELFKAWDKLENKRLY
ncbi:nucleoside deaminase [bacterium]|nr:MAG: nucleoside deaminase [bacterium]